jgi:signal transduction histidine kinase
VFATLGLFYFAWIFSTVNHLNGLKEEKLNSIKLVVEKLITHSADQALRRGDSSQLKTAIKSLIENTEVDGVVVFDEQDTVFLAVGESDLGSEQEVISFTALIVRETLAPNIESDDLFESDRTIVSSERIKTGKVTVYIDQGKISDIVWKTIVQRSYILIIAAILALPAVFVLVRSIIVPLKRINEDVDRFTDGDFSAFERKDFSGAVFKDEIANLSYALSQAAKSIVAKTAQIEKQNEELSYRSAELENQFKVAVEARRQADEALASKDKFLANLYHELKTPLTGSISGFDLLEEQLYQSLSSLDDLSSLNKQDRILIRDKLLKMIQCVDITKYSNNQIDRLVSDLLSVLEISDRELVLEYSSVDLGAMLKGVITPQCALAKAKGLLYSVEITGADGICVKADWVRLAQIFNVLLGNASRFTHEGHIRVDVKVLTTHKSATLNFEVTDTGCGIGEKDKNNIFELFHIAESPRSKKFAGIGTGLTIAKGIAHKMGGCIQLKYTELGVGSCFSFNCTFDLSEKQDKSVKEQALQSPGYDLKVLYVEDSKVNQMVFQAYCEKYGIHLATAENGADGFEKYRGSKFDVLIVDCYMPVVNGFELVEKIRAYEGNERADPSLIVALTADDSRSNREHCERVGFDLFFRKPYSRELFDKIATAVEKRRLQ